MTEHKGAFIALVALVFCGKDIEGSSDTMKQITSTFMKALDECRHEVSYIFLTVHSQVEQFIFTQM